MRVGHESRYASAVVAIRQQIKKQVGEKILADIALRGMKYRPRTAKAEMMRLSWKSKMVLYPIKRREKTVLSLSGR